MIKQVLITLDENIPEYMSDILRCEIVISFDENGNEKNHQNLIDNNEFHSEKELIYHIADRLKISPDIISIEK